MRALEPDACGHVERDGVRVWWESFGQGSPTILFLPTWSVVHSRCWKAQVPYLARHFRVVVFDPRGNGGSDRPGEVAAYAESEFADDALAVMEASGTEQAVVVSWSRGAPSSSHPAIPSGCSAPSSSGPPCRSVRSWYRSALAS
jgi:pimeloyl-ACP methyl ester carboxylesterase